MTKAIVTLTVFVLTIGSAAGAAAHVQIPLTALDDSGIGGFVQLQALPRGGTNIVVVATGLEPGHTYVSLYYDNDVCALEPYSEEDVIGEYTANAAGRRTTRGTADDDLDEIHSVSVRDADTFTLLACATLPAT
jgi:hypothetical protein